jgi:hypothetical protein
MAESTYDLHSGGSGLFKFHYMLVPAQNSSGKSVFCALRLASMEELAPQAAPASVLNSSEPLSAAVVAAVEALLKKVPEEPDKAIPHSSRVHETVEMLMGEARPPPKAAAAGSKGTAAGGSGGGATGSGADGGKAAVVPPANAPVPPAANGAGGSGRDTPQGGRGSGDPALKATGTRAGRGGRGGAAAGATAPKRRR